MKTPVSVIGIFLLSFNLLSCDTERRFNALDLRLDSVLRISRSLAQYERGITFNKIKSLSVRVKIVYSYDHGPDIPEEINFPVTALGYYFQPFLTGCAPGTQNPRPSFYIIANNDGTGETPVPVDGRPHEIPIEQPSEIPGKTTPIIITIRDSPINPCNIISAEAPQAVYTVEMN